MTHSVVKSINRLALVALAITSMFNSCSCKKDDPDAGKDPAKASIAVTVMNRFDGSNVTSASTITAEASTKSYNDVTVNGSAVFIDADESYKTIDKQTIHITATYQSYTETADVEIPWIYGGGEATFGVTIVLGDADYKAELVKSVKNAPRYYYMANSNYAHTLHGLQGITHSGDDYGEEVINWMQNDTEFKLERYETYEAWYGQEVDNFAGISDSNVKKCAEPYNTGVTKTTKKAHLVVSAWSVYSAIAIVNSETMTYEVYKYEMGAKAGKVGEFTVTNYNTLLDYAEAAHPSHASHYVYGKGAHGPSDLHGNQDNAGGGIIIAD